MLVLKFWAQVAACTALALAGLGIPIYFLATGGSAALFGGILAVNLAITLYLLWVYRPIVELPNSPTIFHRRRDPRVNDQIALTFDDGPNGATTAAILDVLKRHEARATFFCVGKHAAAQTDLIRRMRDEGHAIGNHTQDHKKLGWLGRRAIEHQIDAAQASIASAGVPAPVLFRAPHGVKSPLLRGILQQRGLSLCAWSHDIQDFQRPGVSRLIKRANPGLRAGEVVLMHDGGGDRSQTVTALESILVECKRRGLRPVTLSELLAA